MLNVAIIGAGYIGLSHVDAYGQISDANLVAVIDKNIENAKKACDTAGGNCKPYSTLEEALQEQKLDIVDICLPTNLHEECAVQAAEAKCNILCEKPVTFTLESYDRMVNACKKNGVRFMVAQVARWWPEFITIKEYIEEDKLGEIHMIYEKRLAQHPQWTAWHRLPEVSGGGLYDINIHDIDYLYSLFGMPKNVYAIGWKSPSGCWNHISTSLTWESGTKAICETSLEMTGAFPFSIEFRGCGDKGTLSYSLTAGHNIKDGERGSDLVYYPAGGEKGEHIEVEQADMFATEIAAYVKAIHDGTPLPIDPVESRQVLEIILATQKSLETGEVITF